MAAKEKEAEGIALLSMYNDDEDMDLDDEDAEEDNNDSSEGGDIISGTVIIILFQMITPSTIQFQNSIPESHQTLKSPALGHQYRHCRRTLVRWVRLMFKNQEEDHREGEMMGTCHVMFGAELQIATGTIPFKGSFRRELLRELVITQHQAFKQLLLSSHSNWINPSMKLVHQWTILVSILKVAYTPVMGSDEPQQEVDLLENALPPIPNTKCSEELQEKINKFIKYRSAGKSFNADLCNRKDYRNPDFLVHVVTYQVIDRIGTCFSKDVFDHNGYDSSDYYDKIEEDMKRGMEKKEQEKKKEQKVEFVQGGVQSGTIIPTPEISTQISASGLLPVPATADVSSRDRQNKKTK